MIAVAAGDQVTVDPVRDPVLSVTHRRAITVEIMNLDILGLIDRVAAAGLADLAQIAGDFGLAIGGHNLAVGVLRQADGNGFIVKGQLQGVMRNAFGGKPVTRTGPVDQVNGRLFQNAGPDPRQHIVLRLAFKNHIVDAGKVE